jgi:hypothetical protein
MCLSDRENLRYELGQPCEVQSDLVEHLLGENYNLSEARELKVRLRTVCKSKADTYWRLRRATRTVLLTALVDRNTDKVSTVLQRLEQTLTPELLDEYLASYTKQPVLRVQSLQLVAV